MTLRSSEVSELDRMLFPPELIEMWQDGRHPIKWEIGKREWLPMPGEELDLLLVIAGQPGNCKSSKRGLFILLYAVGAPRDDILAKLRVSERTLERWYHRWIEDGIDGLLHLHAHTDYMRWLGAHGPDFALKMQQALHAVRQPRVPELDAESVERLMKILGPYLDTEDDGEAD